MQLRAAIIAEARRWVGTPVRHKHQVLGFGVDCWELVKAIGEANGVLVVTPARFAPFAGYGRQPSPRIVPGILTRFFAPTKRPLPGDIAAIEWRPGLIMHMAIRAEHEGRPTLIHADGDEGRVVEHGIAGAWPERIAGWWRYPGLVKRRG